MKRIFVPTRNGSDWQRLLAKPELHWKQGRSAMTAAACWEAAGGQLPQEIQRTLNSSGIEHLAGLKLLAAIPEWEVPLRGGKRSSFTDVLAITTNDACLCILAVEAKAGEDFGPTMQAKKTEASEGQGTRIKYLEELLGASFAGSIRYQLLHRTASALLVARDFHATSTVMLVHAWNSTPEQRADFDGFAAAMGASRCAEGLYAVERIAAPHLYLGWCEGAPEFLRTSLPATHSA